VRLPNRVSCRACSWAFRSVRRERGRSPGMVPLRHPPARLHRFTSYAIGERDGICSASNSTAASASRFRAAARAGRPMPLRNVTLNGSRASARPSRAAVFPLTTGSGSGSRRNENSRSGCWNWRTPTDCQSRASAFAISAHDGDHAVATATCASTGASSRCRPGCATT